MGKYNRYKNRFEMFLSSDRGKRIMNIVYSWGASIVIIGTMFKILHLPYANWIIGISLSIEALVFFVFGFEKPGGEYHWEDVFPVLKSKNPLDRPDFSGGGGNGGGGIIGGANLGGMVIGGNGEGATIPSGGIAASGGGGGGVVIVGGGTMPAGAAFSGGGAQGAASGEGAIVGGDGGAVSGGGHLDLSGAGGSVSGGGHLNISGNLDLTEEDTKSLSDSIKRLNGAAEQISKMAELTEVTQHYLEKLSNVSDNMDRFSEVTNSLTDVSDTLLKSYQSITDNSDGIHNNSRGYVQQMEALNRNVSGLNTIYEIQLKSISSQIESIEHINSGLGRIREMYDNSVVDSSVFRTETEKMTRQLTELNHVYTRLLQAMTVNMPAAAYPQQPQQPSYPQQGYTQQQPGYAQQPPAHSNPYPQPPYPNK